MEGKKYNDSTVGCFREDVSGNAERITGMCVLNNLWITNGFYKYKNIHMYTWIQPTRRLKCIINYLMIKKETTLSVNDVRFKRGVECATD